MGKIVVLMGKSAAGKDAVYKRMMRRGLLGLRRIVPYTTRPIRANEQAGREYYFVTEEEAERMAQAGKVIERRSYHTVAGVWTYFTADDGQIDAAENYLVIGTPEAYQGFRAWFGERRLVPVYLYADDAERILRSVKREQKQEHPNYAEVCRRFLADETDFSEEKLAEAGIMKRFYNKDLEQVIAEITAYLSEVL